MLTRIALRLIAATAVLPLTWVRLLGKWLGWCLYAVVGSRRRVVRINLRLCFPDWSDARIKSATQATFVHFAQAWLDRGWLWHGSERVIRSRLQLVGDLEALQGNEPTVLFAPHFVGLDAGWTALTLMVQRRFSTIYTDQANKISDAWILRGRRRFGDGQLFGRIEGVKPILQGLKAGNPLYLLPDMNFGPDESVFVPFYGVPAATVPSLSRFAKLTRAKVVPVVSKMTAGGYVIDVLPAWTDFPTADQSADTALMNARLQTYISAMPTQYYWVHKRFKDQPPGIVAPY
jgi:Kdo2-lipid IVA lauroyltransferase/acyltransferase